MGLFDYSTCVYCCPCNTGNTETTVPSFVGSDYYCESGIASGDWNSVLYANNPLWDGQQCGRLEGPCCTLKIAFCHFNYCLCYQNHINISKYTQSQ